MTDNKLQEALTELCDTLCPKGETNRGYAILETARIILKYDPPSNNKNQVSAQATMEKVKTLMHEYKTLAMLRASEGNSDKVKEWEERLGFTIAGHFPEIAQLCETMYKALEEIRDEDLFENKNDESRLTAEFFKRKAKMFFSQVSNYPSPND